MMTYIQIISMLLLFSIVVYLYILYNCSSSCLSANDYLGGATHKYISKDLKKYPRSRCEAIVIKHLESITGKKFPSVNPPWLLYEGKTLELDGYNDELKLAVEFSGPLHTKWNPAFESYTSYFTRVIKDMVKLKTTKRQGVNLFVIDMSLPSRHWRNYILSRLYDFSYTREMPVEYIRPQVGVPFRNKQMERELGLDVKWAAAKLL